MKAPLTVLTERISIDIDKWLGVYSALQEKKNSTLADFFVFYKARTSKNTTQTK